MRVEYSPLAVRDLHRIGSYYRLHGTTSVALAVEQRIRSVIERIALAPDSARQVEQRNGLRVAHVVRFPYRIFYALRGDRVIILLIRHSSRSDWQAGR